MSTEDLSPLIMFRDATLSDGRRFRDATRLSPPPTFSVCFSLGVIQFLKRTFPETNSPISQDPGTWHDHVAGTRNAVVAWSWTCIRVAGNMRTLAAEDAVVFAQDSQWRLLP